MKSLLIFCLGMFTGVIVLAGLQSRGHEDRGSELSKMDPDDVGYVKIDSVRTVDPKKEPDTDIQSRLADEWDVPRISIQSATFIAAEAICNSIPDTAAWVRVGSQWHFTRCRVIKETLDRMTYSNQKLAPE